MMERITDPIELRERKAKILAMRLDGLSYATIARRVGLSRQRIQQLTSPPRGIRKLVVQTAFGRCQECGIGVGRSGQVHHRLVRDATPDDYNDPENLVLLCRSCHRRAHFGTPT